MKSPTKEELMEHIAGCITKAAHPACDKPWESLELIANITNPNSYTYEETQWILDRALLGCAAQGSISMVHHLLVAGANVHTALNGETALFKAAEGGHKDIVKLIRRFGGLVKYKVGARGRKIFDAAAAAQNAGYKL